MSKILLSGETGYRAGALAQFCDLVETAQIVKNPRWSGGLDIDGLMFIKASAAGKGKPVALRGSRFKVGWDIEPLSC